MLNSDNVDFRLQARTIIPTMFRNTSKMLQWVYAMLSPIEWAHKLDTMFIFGALDYPFWDASLVIAPGERVKRHGKLYENISGVNQNGPDPLVSPTLYKVVLPDWRGMARLVRYNSQLIILEFAMNEWFNLNFMQPSYLADPDIYHSDIYIIINEAKDNYFVVFEDTASSSAVWELGSNAEDAVFENTTVAGPVYDFIVKYPASEFTNANMVSELRGLIDQYLCYGTTYNVESY